MAQPLVNANHCAISPPSWFVLTTINIQKNTMALCCMFSIVKYFSDSEIEKILAFCFGIENIAMTMNYGMCVMQAVPLIGLSKAVSCAIMSITMTIHANYP